MTEDSSNKNKFDLEDRTAKFGGRVVKFSFKIEKNTVTIPIISQLVRAGTSIGAMYCEASDAESGKDFKHKISIAKKEAHETRYWLKTLIEILENDQLRKEAEELYQEAKELHLILNAIVNKINNKNKV